MYVFYLDLEETILIQIVDVILILLEREMILVEKVLLLLTVLKMEGRLYICYFFKHLHLS